MMSVLRAILLSSQSKAKTGIRVQPPFVLLGLEFSHVDYWLIATHYSALKVEQQKDIFTLDMFTTKAGEDGKFVMADKPYKTCQLEGKEAFLDYLRMFDFHPDSDWYPVEL